jgi:hypothetical protein
MDSDAKFFSSLGLNCIRLPFNYHHFEGAKIPFGSIASWFDTFLKMI